MLYTMLNFVYTWKTNSANALFLFPVSNSTNYLKSFHNVIECFSFLVFDPCEKNPCQHSGTCVINEKEKKHECLCTQYQYGDKCEGITFIDR